MSDVTTQNFGQLAGINYGGMHMHHHEIRLLNKLVKAQQLNRGRIEEVMSRFAPREYRRHEGAILDRAGAARLLADLPYLVLLGAPGSGVGTAAEALLKEFSEQGKRLEQIRIDEEQTERFSGADLPARRRTVYLLRLPGAQKRVEPHLAKEIQGHATRLRELDAHLVVAGTWDVWQAAGGFRGPNVLDVAPPAGLEVLRRHPVPSTVDIEGVIADPRVQDLLLPASVEDSARFAQIIDEAARHRGDLTTDDLVTQALGAYRGWEDVLETWFDDKSHTLRARLFLTAAAMLEGQPAHRVLNVLDGLHKQLGGTISSLSDGLASAGLRALTKEVGAEREREQLWFTRAGYAEATLSFLHSDRETRFREGLWQWAVGLPLGRDRQEAQSVGGQVAEMMVKIVLRHQDPLPLYALKQWANQENLHEVVVEALTAAAVSEEVGSPVRAQLLSWASAETTDPQFQRVIARVAAREMADLYPRMALTRLGHLAARHNPAVRTEVVTAVEKLWQRPHLRAGTIRALSGWVADPARRDTAWWALGRLARSEVHPLTVAEEQDGTRRDLIAAVAEAVIDPEMSSRIEELFMATLDATLRATAERDIIVQFFADIVQFSSGGSTRVAVLQWLLFSWQPTADDAAHPERRDLRARVAEALSTVDPLRQG